MGAMTHPLALFLLSNKRKWTDSHRLDTATTTLMLISGGLGLIPAWLEGIDEQRYRLDSRLIADLYASCPRALKLTLACTAGMSRLEPAVFGTLFRDAYRQKPRAVLQRRDLALTLEAFLNRHPARAREYKDIILELLWSPHEELCLRGVYLTGLLDDLEERDLARLKRKLCESTGLRMNTLNGLCRLVKRHRKLSPRVLAFCTSPELKQLASRIYRKDPEKDARTCAYYFLKALREYESPRRKG